MYINDPLLKLKRGNKLVKSQSERRKKLVEQKKSPDDQEYQLKMLNRIEDLLERVEKTLYNTKEQIRKTDHICESEEQNNAFIECLELIDIKFSNYERHHRKILNSIEKKIFELEEYQNSFSNEVKKMKKETENIKAENEESERKRRIYNRNKDQGKSIKLQIEQGRNHIEEIHEKIQESITRSIKQKDQFVEIQGQQFLIQQRLFEEEQQQRFYQDAKQLVAQYEKLLIIKDQIKHHTREAQKEVEQILEHKIKKMAKLRTNLKHIDHTLENYKLQIDSQTYIIEGLRNKYHEVHMFAQDQNLYNEYRNKYNDIYNQIYFSKSIEGNKWLQYEKYVKKLLKKQRKRNSRVITEIQDNRKYSQVLDLRNNRSKILQKDKFLNKTKTTDVNSFSKMQKNNIYLPKIVKMNGEQEDQKEIKQKLIQSLKQENKNNPKKLDQLQLVSIESGNSSASGSVIQVQFHRK